MVEGEGVDHRIDGTHQAPQHRTAVSGEEDEEEVSGEEAEAEDEAPAFTTPVCTQPARASIGKASTNQAKRRTYVEQRSQPATDAFPPTMADVNVAHARAHTAPPTMEHGSAAQKSGRGCARHFLARRVAPSHTRREGAGVLKFCL